MVDVAWAWLRSDHAKAVAPLVVCFCGQIDWSSWIPGAEPNCKCAKGVSELDDNEVPIIIRHKAEVTFENHIHLCNTSDPKVFAEFLRAVADRIDPYIPDPEPCELCTPEHIHEMMNHLGHARALAAYGRHVASAHPEKYPPTELPLPHPLININTSCPRCRPMGKMGAVCDCTRPCDSRYCNVVLNPTRTVCGHTYQPAGTTALYCCTRTNGHDEPHSNMKESWPLEPWGVLSPTLQPETINPPLT